MKLNVPPLKIWLIVFFFGLVFGIGFYIFSASKFGIQFKTALEIQKLIKNNYTIKKDTVSVIIVGSSLTRNAFGDNFDISEAFTKQLGVPVKSLKINLYSLTMDKAIDLAIFESINKYPPDILFIESRLFIDFLKNPKRIPFHLTYSLGFLASEIKKMLGYSEIDNSIDTILNPELLSDYFTTKINKNFLDALLKTNRRVRYFAENKAVNILFDQLKKQKKKVILLGFPNNYQVNKVFDKTELEFSILAKQYKNAYNLDYWSINTLPSNANFYTDGSHLNYQGAKLYQKWFLEKIKSNL